jgi:hypothetical protein
MRISPGLIRQRTETIALSLGLTGVEDINQ